MAIVSEAAPPKEAALLLRILTSSITEGLYLSSYLLRVPVFALLLGMMIFMGFTLQEVYPRAAAILMPPIMALLPDHVHLEDADFAKLYALLAAGWYLLTRPMHLFFPDTMKRLTYKVQLVVLATILTVGWGFVIWNVQFIKVAPDSTRAGIAGVFFLFYAGTLMLAGVSLLLSRAADAIVRFINDRILAALKPERNVAGFRGGL